MSIISEFLKDKLKDLMTISVDVGYIEVGSGNNSMAYSGNQHISAEVDHSTLTLRDVTELERWIQGIGTLDPFKEDIGQLIGTFPITFKNNYNQVSGNCEGKTEFGADYYNRVPPIKTVSDYKRYNHLMSSKKKLNSLTSLLHKDLNLNDKMFCEEELLKEI